MNDFLNRPTTQVGLKPVILLIALPIRVLDEKKMNSLTCIVVDDDEIDRLATISFIRKYPFLRIQGVFSSPEEVLPAIKTTLPDVLFLDIDMPKLTGLDLRDRLMEVPVCIFITSYAEYAVESFEKEAFDFLIKPVNNERFEKTMIRVQDYFTLRHKAAKLDTIHGEDSVFIKEGHDRIRISINDIQYLEALKDYTRVVTPERKYCVLSSLGNLLKEEPFNSFIRIHKSFAVRRQHIKKITSSTVQVKDIELPVGRVYKEALDDLKLL